MHKNEIIMKVGILLFVLFSIPAFADEALCPEYDKKATKSKSAEQNWHLPQKAFSKKNAKQSLEIINSLVSDGNQGADWISIEHHLKMVKGHLYIQALEFHKKEFGGYDNELKKKFCKFLEKEGYVFH